MGEPKASTVLGGESGSEMAPKTMMDAAVNILIIQQSEGD